MKLHVVMPVINCLDMTKDAIDSVRFAGGANIILIDNASNDGTQRWATGIGPDPLPYGNKLTYVRNEARKSVAASWNQGTRLAFEDPECEYVAILNNDIILHPKTLEHMAAFMDKTGYLMTTGDNIKDRMSIEQLLSLDLPVPYTDFDTWKIEGWRAEGPDFSCYLINRETIRVIGWFDENFHGAYCEDQDYHARSDRARRHIAEHNDQGIALDRIHFKRLSTAPYYHFASQTIARVVEVRHDIATQHGKNEQYYTTKWGGPHPEVMDGHGNMTPFGDASKSWRDW